MASRIEDYALLGDTHTAALVSREGSIDWWCVPRFDAGACFAALLGTEEHGLWRLAPANGRPAACRAYRPGTLVLDTRFESADGAVTLTDFMPICSDERIDLVRVLRGERGRVPIHMELVIRFDDGSIVPWVRRAGDALLAVGGPDALALRTPAAHRGEDFRTRADFTVVAGESIPFVLTWYPSHRPPPPPQDAATALAETERWWRDWSGRCRDCGPWRDAVDRSLMTLKALTFSPTGGIVAAPTTSLPERIGGERNWDYRFCWLRDATFTLYALLSTGYVEEARVWREWLLRAAAGRPQDLAIMYGVSGERRLTEQVLDHLPGYEGSHPVRRGNAAHRQFQLDVYGEVMDVLHVERKNGIDVEPAAWALQEKLLDFLESNWQRPDEGIWEVRGPRQHFTHSRMMAWVAFDRAVRAVERFGCEGPLARWRGLRDTIHAEVCARGYDAARGAFVQAYGSRRLDASLLLMPLVGFLPATDPRVAGTAEAIRRELSVEGLLRRYSPEGNVDGLPGHEGVFLACSFWLADNLALQGRRDEARALFERLLSLRNDVGLLAEEYDPQAKRLLGNFPQALSHIALVNTALNLHEKTGPMHHRARS